MTEKIKQRFSKIEDALGDFKMGRIVIVADDADRENEGDFVCAAQAITPDTVNFMLSRGRGVLCAPLAPEVCDRLELPMMVRDNTSVLGTPFTVSVDLLGSGCTTGVSTHDRAATLRALAHPGTRPQDLGRPGHIFALRARAGGVFERNGHTEAVVDMARLCGLYPAGALIEILNPDGTMARMPQLLDIARQYGLKVISIEDLIAYREQVEGR